MFRGVFGSGESTSIYVASPVGTFKLADTTSSIRETAGLSTSARSSQELAGREPGSQFHGIQNKEESSMPWNAIFFKGSL